MVGASGKNKKGKRLTRIPKIFVVSGPGGVGKTTLIKRLFRKKTVREKFSKTISFTTRGRRPGEKNGRDYFFVTKEEFIDLKKKGFFLEDELVVQDYYGTPKYFCDEALNDRKSLILCIDVKGGMYLKNKYEVGKIVTIFVAAPKSELYKRLKKRTEKKEFIKNRILLAERELFASRKYDYLVVNKNIKDSLKVLEAILLAETFREERK